MQSPLLFFSFISLAALAVDLYAFRRLQRLVEAYPRLRWAVLPSAVLMAVMPLALPLYALASRGWGLESPVLRRILIALWLVYYVPRLLFALLLVLADAVMATRPLFFWFRYRLLFAHPQPASDAPGAPMLDLADMRTMNRFDFVRTMGGGAATAPFAVVGYSIFRRLYDFDVRRVSVPVPGLPRALDGLTIAQLSDLHAGSLFSERPMQDAVDVTLGLGADLIALTGDYVNSSFQELPVITPALSRLHADLGVYASLGNHDHYTDVRQVVAGLREAGLEVLVNAHKTQRVEGASLHIVGTDNTGFNQRFGDLGRAVEGLPAPGEDEAFRLLLAHDPTFWESPGGPRERGIDLTLSGHTHGGQIGFEWGPLRWSPARVMYRRWAGLYTEQGSNGPQHLYVNRGLGTVGPPLRLGIRPEISLLTLVRVEE